jgi:hypothetical protein
MMMMDMMHMGRGGPNDPVRLLMLTSFFREDMPWLYELAMEVYRATKAGLPEDIARARRDFRRAIEVCSHGPMGEEVGFDPEMHHMLMRELERTFPPEPQPEEAPKEKARRKKETKGNG